MLRCNSRGRRREIRRRDKIFIILFPPFPLRWKLRLLKPTRKNFQKFTGGETTPHLERFISSTALSSRKTVRSASQPFCRNAFNTNQQAFVVYVLLFFLFFFFPPKSRLPVKSPDKISSKSTRSPNKTLSNEIKISRLHINYEKKKKKKEKINKIHYPIIRLRQRSNETF